MGLGKFKQHTNIREWVHEAGIKNQDLSRCKVYAFFIYIQYCFNTNKNMENLLKFVADRKTSTLDEKSRFYKSLTNSNGRAEFKKHILGIKVKYYMQILRLECTGTCRVEGRGK